MTVYVIEYRHLVDKERGIWSSKISQDGYGTLEEAQAFIETRSGHPEKCSDFYYRRRPHSAHLTLWSTPPEILRTV